MKKHQKTTKEEREFKGKNGKYKGCKRSKDGLHTFELRKPSWAYLVKGSNVMSVKKFYQVEDKIVETENELRKGEKYIYLRSKWRYWACVDCGKCEVDTQEGPNKKIRSRLKEDEAA